jgi:hypothetical protein
VGLGGLWVIELQGEFLAGPEFGRPPKQGGFGAVSHNEAAHMVLLSINSEKHSAFRSANARRALDEGKVESWQRTSSPEGERAIFLSFYAQSTRLEDLECI